MIYKLVIVINNMEFVSISTVYEDNTSAIVLSKSSRITTTSNYIAVKYHWLRNHAIKAFLIRKMDSENQKASILTKGLKGELFVRNRKLMCVW